MNRTGNNTTGWARRLTALLITACLVMAMALPVYAKVDPLPDAPGEVELLEDEQGTASGEDTVPPEQNAATPVPDAATPEPEQSAGPEQPAPTETPEPTAEPTPTPEPAATATATPVPTVTPTATPEPTEQPQKMYAAKSVENVQAASEQANGSFVLYFMAPSSWGTLADGQEVWCYGEKQSPKDGNATFDKKVDGTETGVVSGTKRAVYKITLTAIADDKNSDCPYGGFYNLRFYVKDVSGKVSYVIKDGWQNIDEYKGKCYDGENGKWTDFVAYDPNNHLSFAGNKMVFENLSDSNLANVTAVFYEKDGDTLKEVKTVTIDNVAAGKKQKFEIPNVECSYVQFFADDKRTQLSVVYNFYDQETENAFQYDASGKYCYTYKAENTGSWGTPQGKQDKQVVYFDATFSWLSYENEKNETHNGAIGCGMPTNDGKLWCYLTGDGKAPITKQEMKRLKDTNIWYYEVPEGYTKIRFASWAVENEKAADNGDGTVMMDIPADLSEPCFFADASDDVIYNGGIRGGYWAEKGTPRDAKEGKKLTDDVVDISKATFKEEANTKYVSSTLYDYYTDYELNGNNRDKYNSEYYTPGKGGGFASQRSWVVFRQFDRALSDYYSNCNAQYPIYTGHFQPTYLDWGIKFETISSELNLFGFNLRRFMAINNSTINEDGSGTRYDYAYQGLVQDHTSTSDATGEPLLKDTKEDTKVVEPHFNKEFLSGTNSKNAKLGDVYNNVAFPFTKKQIFDEDKGVDCWYFDSQDTTLYLKQDSDTKQYFLKSSTENRERSRNLDSDSAQKTITKNGQNVSSYGYFPFNETATVGRASTYNYGFGTKLQMDFTLTDDGMVEADKADGKTSIKFFFSGDDDVWVFIDGQLALDVGGAHGKVSGLLEFGKKEEEGKEKNSVTAYVSKVKKGGTPESNQNGSPAKTVKYNGEDINFYAQGTTLTFDKGQKHTLTMYYMERGMWESNMAVAFNFPDNNELQVQKEVDLTNVTDDDFKKCFTGQKIFNFTIQNQATHYGKTDAAEPDPSDTEVVNLTATGNMIEPATPGKKDDYIFELVKNPWPDPKPDSGQDPGQDTGQNTEQVLHWYARYTDTQSAAREKRRGILTLGNPINIENMRFLTFQVYVGSNDGGGGDLSLNNLYLELLDDQNPAVQKGSLDTSGINGATYGSVEVKPDQWVTVKLDLHKMKEKGKFSGNVTTIRVGDNYSRNIYFRNFTFIPKAVPSKMTGFTTDQEKIPDYGSAKSGNLENAKYAQYTSTEDTDTQLVDGDGRFVLEAGETVTFSDQFRRGSYISLKEELNQNLYDTKWTVYENGQKVTSMEGGKSVSLSDPTPPLIEQNGSGPDDGRTENITDKTEQESGGVQNNYNGKKPTTANTIVFRSYKDPDETSSTLTKLKVEYVNTVKTGGLKIQKKAADGEDENIKGIYTFKVTFSDVGGAGLEKKPIEKPVTIDMSQGNTGTITGIPVGTRYTIEEVETSDGSTLQSVTVPDGQYAHVIGKTMVEGEIVESNNPNDLEVTAIFTNTKRKLINIEFNKLWEDADGTDLSTKKPPDTIYIQLQRRLKNGTGYTDWEPVNYPTADSPDYVTINRDDYGWKCIFNNLDQYPINGSADNNYIYRIVEGTVENGKFKQAAEDGTITINGNTYVVKAKATPKSETNNAGSSTGNTATVTPDGTITGGSGTIVLTNTLQNPKFGLNIIKKDAENGENNKEVFLKDVEFKLEKLKETTTEGKTQYTVDTGYKFSSNENKNYLTGITGADGKITGVFTNLEPGTYRLTETRAHPGYNLLAQPIVIKFTQDGKCFIDGQAIEDEGKFKPGANNTYTMTLTVLNRKTPELPHTGADAPSLWLLIGMPLAVAGLLIFTFRYNRKGGRRH